MGEQRGSKERERDKRWQKWARDEEGDERTTDKRADRLPPHRHVTQFTMFCPIMFYSTISDSTVVSSDLISQPISFSNVNTKGEAEPLAASSATHA